MAVASKRWEVPRAAAAGGGRRGGGGGVTGLEQAIRLLQMSRLELLAEIRKELEEQELEAQPPIPGSPPPR